MSRIKRNVRLRVESLEGRQLLSGGGLLDPPPSSPNLLTTVASSPDFGSTNSGSSSSNPTSWYAQDTGGGTAAAPFVPITPPGQNPTPRNWTVDANGDVTQTGPPVSSPVKPYPATPLSPPPKAPAPTVSLIVKVGGGMQAVGGGIQG